MFDIGFIEIVVICLVGLVVIGPSRLPEALRTGAMWLGRGKRMLGNVRRDLENEIGIDEIRRDLRNEQIMSEIKAENLEEERERQQKAQEQAQGENNSGATPPAPSKPKTHTNSYLDSANQNGKPSEPPHSESESLADTDSQASQSAEHKNN